MSKAILKKHCRISKFVKTSSPLLHEVLDDYCLLEKLSGKRNLRGVTFIMPSDATVKKLAADRFGDKFDDAIALGMSHIIQDYLPKPADWKANESDIPNGIGKKVHAKVVGATVELRKDPKDAKPMAVLEVETKYVPIARDTHTAVYKIKEGSIELNLDAPKASYENARKPFGEKKQQVHGGGDEETWETIVKKYCAAIKITKNIFIGPVAAYAAKNVDKKVPFGHPIAVFAYLWFDDKSGFKEWYCTDDNKDATGDYSVLSGESDDKFKKVSSFVSELVEHEEKLVLAGIVKDCDCLVSNMSILPRVFDKDETSPFFTTTSKAMKEFTAESFGKNQYETYEKQFTSVAGGSGGKPFVPLTPDQHFHKAVHTLKASGKSLKEIQDHVSAVFEKEFVHPFAKEHGDKEQHPKKEGGLP